MSNAVKKTPTDKKSDVVNLFSDQKSVDSIKKTHTTELVIALCGPIGSPLHDVAAALENKLLTTFDYQKCTKIRMSSLISEFAGKVR